MQSFLRKWWRREGINWYWVYWAKIWSKNDENAIDFKWSDVQGEDEEDIAKVNFNDNFQNQVDEENFPQKNNWRIVWLLRYWT